MSKAERRRTRVSSTIDKLPDDIKGQLDVRLADTSNTYEELAAWLKAEGYEISKSAIGRYAIRTTQAAQRVAQTIQRTQAIAQAVEAHPDLDYTKAASMVLMDGLMQRVSTAEDDFQEMPLDKAGRLIASLARNATYEKRVRQDMKKKLSLPSSRWRRSSWRQSSSTLSLLASFTTCWSVQERRCWQMAKIDLNDYLEKLTEPEDRETVANRAYQRELFEQYVTKDGNFPEQRAQLLEDFRAGKELTGPKGLRRKLGAFDLEYFGRAYLAHYFVRPSPKFHGELDRIWREGVLKGMNPEVDAKRISRADGCRRAIEAPRGHAKSTTFTFKDDLHAAVYGYKHYIIILSDSSEQAEGFLVDIKTELEENAALKEDFGELEGKVWKSSVILLANGVKIEAIGSGKKIRGRRHKQWRPDLIVCDDLENDENVNTPEQRKKLRDWFYKAVSKAGDTYTDIVYIGTLLHFDALLANVAKNPSYKSVRYQGVISFATNGELWDAWESIFTDLSNDNRQEDALEFFQANREAMLEGTAVLWEEKLSYYDLMVIRISEGEASFNSEIQNDPIDPENCTFQEEWFDFWDDEGKAQPDFSDPKFLFVGANDPSLGKNKKSDTSSIIALAKDTQTGYLYVVIADIAKRKPDQIIEDALDASRRLQREYKRPYYKFGVETVQFQYYFAEIMRQRAAAVGEYLPIEEINSTQNKDARIQSLQPFVKNGYIKFSKKHKTLLKQMTEYPMGKNDDAPDGLQMAVKLALDVKIGRRVDYRSVIARALDFRRGAY